jgi:hypothetical protein
MVRLLESKNDLVSEGASEALLHIVTPPEEGMPLHQANHAAVRAAGAIPTLLNLVWKVLFRFCMHSTCFLRPDRVLMAVGVGWCVPLIHSGSELRCRRIGAFEPFMLPVNKHLLVNKAHG